MLFLLSLTTYSQDLTLTSKNTLANNTIAYTYTISTISPSNVSDSVVISQQYSDVSSLFLTFKNIVRATFDSATGLITVIGTENSKLPLKISSNEIITTTLDDGTISYTYKGVLIEELNEDQ